MVERRAITSDEWQRGFWQLAAELAYMQHVGRDALKRRDIIATVAAAGMLPPSDLLDLGQKCRYTVRWRDILITVLHRSTQVPVEELAEIFDKSIRNVYRSIERASLNDRRVIASLCGAIGAGQGKSRDAGTLQGAAARAGHVRG